MLNNDNNDNDNEHSDNTDNDEDSEDVPSLDNSKLIISSIRVDTSSELVV